MTTSTPNRLLCSILLCLVCLASGAIRAAAQSEASTGQIAGAVRDSAGAAIPNATVKATSAQTGLERTATTSEDGLFRIVLLPPGTYNLTAEASGFAKATLNKVEVAVGQTTDANLTVGVGAVQEAVTVTSEGVQTTVPTADSLLNVTAISELPINGRRFQDFVTLTPTAQVDPQRGQISLAGQRGINTVVNVDGTDYTQPFFGGIRGGERSNFAPTIPQEAIQEFQVVATGYSPEFGRSTGGIINAVTKSGTNDFHGSAFFLDRPHELSRNTDFFKQQAEFLNREVIAAPTQTQWGGSFGGRLKRDRAFFFGSYEQQRVRNPHQVFFSNLATFTPTAATQEAYSLYKSLEQPFTQTNDSKVFLGRFDYQFSQANRFNVRYSRSTYEGLNATSVGNSLLPTIQQAISNNGTEQDSTHTVVGQLTSIIRSDLINEVRGQYSRETRPRLANAQQPTVSNSTVGNFGTVNFLGQNIQYDWRVQVFDNLTWTSGNHTIKFGAEVNHTFATQTFGFNQYGAFSISGSNVATILDILSYTPSVTTGVVNRFDDPTVTYNHQIGNLQASLVMNEFSMFAQDSWRIRPNFTLNYGLRWEGQFNPQPEANNDILISQIRGYLAQNGRFPSGQFIDPTKIPDSANELGPRVGFAWDPFGGNKTVVRGYAGIYYARTPLLSFAGPINNFRVPAGDLSIQLPLAVPAGNPNNTVYKQLKLIGIDLNNYTLDKLPILTAEQVQSVAQALGLSNFNPFTGVQPILMSADFRNPKSYQWGAGFEREVARGLTVSADFSYVNTVHLERNRDVNLPAPLRSVSDMPQLGDPTKKVNITDPAQRPFFGLLGSTSSSIPADQRYAARPRPIPTLGAITVRESTARSLYRGLSVRTNLQRKWGQINASYTLSKSLSDDDNERDATGFNYENAFNLAPEYSYSRLDRRHIFGAGTVFFLPYGFEASSGVRIRSGVPLSASFGSDVNEDRGGPDRPYSAAGVPFPRNIFRDRATYVVDLRLQKGIKLGESRTLSFSAEFFNLFNFNNITFTSATGGVNSAVVNYCASPVPRDCGFGTPTNLNFLSITDNNPTSTRYGKLILTNTGGDPFQIQFGARFRF